MTTTTACEQALCLGKNNTSSPLVFTGYYNQRSPVRFFVIILRRLHNELDSS